MPPLEKQLSIWEEQKNPMVRMHNSLIVSYIGRLEMNEMRIFLLMLAQVKWGATALEPFKIYLRDIDQNLKIGPGNEHFRDVIKAAENLKTKMRDIKMVWEENGKRVYQNSTLIDNLRYREGTDYLEGNWGVAIAPYLLNLKGNFTSEELRELLKLKSTYAVRFYMLIKSLYRSNQVLLITVAELRKMMLGEFKPGEAEPYPEYKIFKREVLVVAMNALKHTTSAFRLEEERVGRFVEKLTLIPMVEPMVLPGFSRDIEELLVKYKVNPKKIRYMFANGDLTESFIRYTFEMCLMILKGTHVKIGGFIHDALVERKFWDNYQSMPKSARQEPATGEKREWVPYSDLEAAFRFDRERRATELTDIKEWITEHYLIQGFTREKIGEEWGVLRITFPNAKR